MKIAHQKGRQMQEIMGHSSQNIKKKQMKIEIDKITETDEEQ